MSSLFDSSVYALRNQTPYTNINLVAFMQDMIWNFPDNGNPWDHGVSLTCQYRKDVSTGRWWTLEWTSEDKERHHVDSQDLQLCLWRAVQTEMNIRDRIEDKESDS